MEKIERMKRELVYKGHIIDVYKDTVKIPNGNIAEWDFIDHRGAAAVLPVTDDGNIIMVKQYRNALNRYTLEIPAGGLESPDERMDECAARELEEETGCLPGRLRHLLTLRTTVAFCNEKIEVFLADNLIKSHPHPDEDEYIDVCVYSMDELLEQVYAGRIEDSKTVSAILAYYARYIKK